MPSDSKPLYSVSFTQPAMKQLEALETEVATRLANAIGMLQVEPRHPGVKKMRGATDRYRVRAGDYRAIFVVDDTNRTVVVVRVGHRRDIYER